MTSLAGNDLSTPPVRGIKQLNRRKIIFFLFFPCSAAFSMMKILQQVGHSRAVKSMLIQVTYNTSISRWSHLR
jgi:hypothetical protein